MSQLPPFTLYGLIGCDHCSNAEKFLRSRGMSSLIMIANDDPIISAGIKQITGKNEYPVLVSRLGEKEIITGFKEEDYERISKLFYSLVSPSAPSIFGGEQQSQPQTSSQAPPSSNT